MKYHIIVNEKFQQLQELQRAAANQWQRRKIRNILLDSIECALGRKARLAKKTLLVIEEIVFKASDRGYSFCGRQTLADKLNVSLRTIDNAIRLLKESGQVIVCYRENPNGNSCRTPVIIFKEHANFPLIMDILSLECDEVCEEESGQVLRETRDIGSNSVPTYLFTLKQEKEILKKYPHIVKYVALKIAAVEEKNPAGIAHLGAYIDKVNRMEIRKAINSSKRAKQPMNEREVKRFPLIHFYEQQNQQE